jgi:Na+/H+ antiporter NhaD/arsenite permease-like protein
MNWGVLIFFAGMFVVMRAVWDSSIGSSLLSFLPKPTPGARLESTGTIMINSVFLSQILSNVPFVQLYTFEMHALSFTSSSTVPWLALAAGSTLAGNLTLLGAVSNVIILDSAEARKQKAFSFFEFLKYGSVVTLVTCFIFLAFLVLI